MRVLSVKKIKLDKPIKVYDLGVRSKDHIYALANGCLVSNSWSHPADAIRYMVKASYGKLRNESPSAKLLKKRKVSNVVDGLAF